ncbi:NAD(P)/FAD-dependent oxidoreductase [Thermodesulfobacteriota bacterium]
MIKKTYDVIIVGAGPAGLLAAYYLAEHSNLRILILEKGRALKNRDCLSTEGQECRKCSPCNILSGIGGAGLFSDGKLNFATRIGQTDLTQFMSPGEAQALIDETEEIFACFGMNGPAYPTDMEAARRMRESAKRHGIELLLLRQKHVGSDRLPKHIATLAEHIMSRGVEIRTSESVRDVAVEASSVTGVSMNRSSYVARYVILAPGRVGAEWLSDLATRRGLGLTQRGIEVGVRVEVHNDIMQDVCGVIYDPVFFVQTGKYDDQTRTFCTNFGGYVSLENYVDFVCVNGHAYIEKKSENTNFAFLSKVVLTEPVTDNRAYGEAIGKLATLIGGGKPILQRFGDLKRGRRSTWSRVKKGYITPTMAEVVCGDIAMALPERILSNIIDGLEKLNQVVPGVSNDEALLYAPEIKFFATQIETGGGLETKIRGLYVAGDGAGVSGNIVSAAASGIIAAKAILASM